jgi:hypothetical protein
MIAALRRYFVPVESVLHRTKGRGSMGFATETRVYSKGLNLTQVGNLIARKMAAFKSPVAVTFDESRCEAHSNEEMYAVLDQVLQWFFGGEFPSELLEWGMNPICRTDDFEFAAANTLLSGWPHTSLIACITCMAKALMFLRDVGVAKFDILDNGDDIIIFVEEKDFGLLYLAPTAYLRYGAELKLENVARSPEQVVFCQCRPVEYMPGKWKMSADPRKMFSTCTFMAVPRMKANEQARQLMMRALGDLVLNSGMPILQELALYLKRSAEATGLLKGKWAEQDYGLGNDPDYSFKLSSELRGRHLLDVAKVRCISDCARESFSEAWDMLPEEQYDVEHSIRSWPLLKVQDLCDDRPKPDSSTDLLKLGHPLESIDPSTWTELEQTS